MKAEAGSVVNLASFTFMSFWKHVEARACQGIWSGSFARCNLLKAEHWSTEEVNLGGSYAIWLLEIPQDAMSGLSFLCQHQNHLKTLLYERMTKMNSIQVTMWHMDAIIHEKAHVYSWIDKGHVKNMPTLKGHKK